MEDTGEVCLEEEVERLRRSGMYPSEIAQKMGVDESWVEELISRVGGTDLSAAERGSDRGLS